MKKMKCIKGFYVEDARQWYNVGDEFDVYTIDEVKGLECADFYHAKNSSGLDDDTVGYLKELDGQFLPVWRRDAEELVVEPKDVRRVVYEIDCHSEYKLDEDMIKTFSELPKDEYDKFVQRLSNNTREALYDILSQGMENTVVNVKVVGIR